MSKIIKTPFTILFLKVFIVLEFSLIIFYGILSTWLAYTYHQNNYEQMRHQTREFSQILYSNAKKRIEKYQFNGKLFSQDINSMMKDINKIKIMFVLDSEGSILSHQDASLIGEHMSSAYVKLKLANNFNVNKIGLFQDIINKNDKIEYQYFYQYFLGDEIKHPIYTTKKFLAYNQKTGNILKRYFYIVWSSKILFLFSWVDGIIALLIITHISFAAALIFERMWRKTNEIVKKQNEIIKKQMDETASQVVISKAPTEETIPKQNELSKDTITPVNANNANNTNNTENEEIPEAIILN